MNFDSSSIRARILSSLSAKESWATVLDSGSNARLIDIFAEALAQLALYDDYTTVETKWAKARNKSSLMYQSGLLRYYPHRKIGATGQIKVSSSKTFDAANAEDITIPIYTVFSNEDGDIEFTTISTSSLANNENYTLVDVIQGTPKSVSFIATGATNETFHVSDSGIENSFFSFTVNGEEWTNVEELLTENSTAKVYMLVTDDDFGGVAVKTGDDVFGKKLTTGDELIFHYAVSLGMSGNITSSDVVTSVVSTLYDVNSDPVTTYCTNDDTLDGGKDEETLEEIRANAPAYFQTHGGKSSTKTEYETVLKSLNTVYNAVVWGAYEQNLDAGGDPWDFIPEAENLLYISAFTPSGNQLSTAQKVSIIQDLNDGKSPTDIPTFVDVSFINLIFNVTAYISDKSYTLSTVKSNTLSGISTEYDLFANDFEKNLPESDYKSFIDGIEGVDHHTTTLEIVQLTTFNSAYEATANIELYPIEAESVKVYIKDTTNSSNPYVLVGTDDGAGGFTAEAGYDLTGSDINYNTGAGSLVVASGLSGTYTNYSIKYVYSLVSTSITLNSRNQIFRYYDSNISVQYTRG